MVIQNRNNSQKSNTKLSYLFSFISVTRHTIQLLEIFYCVLFIRYCVKMPSLPQGAFAVCKLREETSKNVQKAIAKKTELLDLPSPVYNRKLVEYLPVKYNEKFMNAIWGHYNRYSPHNIKSNEAAGSASTSGTNLISAASSAQHQQ